MKYLYLSVILVLPCLNLYGQKSFYAKCIAESSDLSLNSVQNQIKQKKNLQDLKTFSDDKSVNQQTWANIIDVCHNNYGDHPDFKESQLTARFYSSIAAKTLYEPKDLASIAPEIIKQYVCLKKNYGLRYDIEPEFLSEKEYYQKYTDTTNNYDPAQHSFMQSLMMRNHDYRLRVQKSMSKCISKKDVDW